MIKLMGFLDIIASALLFLSLFNLRWDTLFIIFMLYLFFKGVIFIISSFNFGSIIDIFASLIILLMLIANLPGVLIGLAGVLLFQKGVFSFF
jgi:hypothetical protein